MITFRCPCGQSLQVRDEHAGSPVQCPACKQVLNSPRAEAIQSAPTAVDRGEFDRSPPRDRDDDRPRRRGEDDRLPRRDSERFDPYEDGYDSRRRRPAATSGLAIASLVCGCATFLIPVLCSIPAVILGILALRDIKRRPDRVTGAGMAIAGLITGLVGNISILGYLGIRHGISQANARVTMQNNLRQIGVAMHNFHDVQQRFPAPGFGGPNFKPDSVSNLSWRVQILPYIEQDSLYRQFRFDEPWDSPHNIQLLPRIPPVYQPLGRQSAPHGHTFIQAFTGPNTAFSDPLKGLRMAGFTDGTSNTILLAEASRAVPWTKPEDITLAGPLPPLGGAIDSNVFYALFADGSVRPIDLRLNNEADIRNAIGPNDGMVFNLK